MTLSCAFATSLESHEHARIAEELGYTRVPSLRHPLVTASAIATLVSLAGSHRVSVAVGSGFTGRLAMGQGT